MRASSGGGGGAFVLNLVQRGGALHFERCRGAGNGGGLLIAGSFTQTAGDTAFLACTTAGSGGGMSVQAGMIVAGFNSFKKCTAAAGRARQSPESRCPGGFEHVWSLGLSFIF